MLNLLISLVIITIGGCKNTITVDGENIDKLLREHEYIYLEFYSPDCPYWFLNFRIDILAKKWHHILI